jgi:hypothetical protein
MALDLDGHRVGYEGSLPKLKDGGQESYRLRQATIADLGFIAELYQHAVNRYLIACVRTSEIFKYELNRQSENSLTYSLMFVIEDSSGDPVGYLRHSNWTGRNGVLTFWYELKPGVSWLEVTPAVVRHLWAKGQEYARRDGRVCNAFSFNLGAAHPAYEALAQQLVTRAPYAWYLRVPDLAGFIHLIRPVLEQRVAASIAACHSRELKISFYREGLKLILEKGKLTTIEPWKPSPEEEGNAAFPDRTFLQVLFGYRSYDELHYAFADCWCEGDDVRTLINILFPKKLSNVLPVA